ncbi:MAG: histidine decarboxylase [Gammaproteobacteria bacterium]|nr:histidine decarboxylase [Gammaproteobacteria bacterium]
MPTNKTPLPEALRKLVDEATQRKHEYLGYPVSKDFDYSALAELLSIPLNNLGDPFTESTWKVDSRALEREVVEFFAGLMRAEENNWWGYVTNGGSEGNLYGLYLARELYPNGIVYYSEETHYSVSKNVHLLGLRHIMIRSLPSGEIDYDDLRETIRVHRDVPPIIFANIGTTMTEGKDDIAKISEMMRDMAIPQHYIHSDAALCGPICAFTEPHHPFDFADGADSISISGHKFIGSPIPCGIVLARKEHVDRIARSIAYIGCLDTTITGSRNGLTPAILWAAIDRMGKDGLHQRVEESLALADYAEERLKENGIEAWRNPNAITVVFPAVPEDVKNRWQLATAKGWSHIITVPGVTRELIDRFIADLVAAREAS